MNVNIALLTVTDTRTFENDKSGAILVKKIEEAKHSLIDRKICKDNKEDIKKILKDWINQKNIDKEIGLKHLKILHLNDSKGELGSHLDRHDHIGLGQIGNAGLSKVIKLMNKNKIPIILETPIDDRRDEFEDIGTAKELA